jgi:hypothetical protein
VGGGGRYLSNELFRFHWAGVWRPLGQPASEDIRSAALEGQRLALAVDTFLVLPVGALGYTGDTGSVAAATSKLVRLGSGACLFVCTRRVGWWLGWLCSACRCLSVGIGIGPTVWQRALAAKVDAEVAVADIGQTTEGVVVHVR